jgi:hypothetical protein
VFSSFVVFQIIPKSALAIRAQQRLGIEAKAGIYDGGNLGVINRNPGQKHSILAASDDLAILDDDRTEWASPSFLDRVNG